MDSHGPSILLSGDALQDHRKLLMSKPVKVLKKEKDKTVLIHDRDEFKISHFAFTRFAKPSILRVPMLDVFIVLIGLYM